jgi:diadenosine tetraphosphate (Ap4A) HIT family hydrolase
MANETLRNFGYPGTLVRDYAHWCILLRPAQVTLGALVLAAKSEARTFGGLEVAAFTELATIARDIGNVFESFPRAEKTNYLMLMMVDPNVHFHVLPRYSGSRAFEGITFEDRGWPGQPDLKGAPAITPQIFSSILQTVKSNWPP